MEKFGENCKQTKNNNKIDFSCKNKSDFDQVIDYMQHGLSLSSSIQAMRYNYNYAEVTLPDNISLLSIKNLVKANLKKNTKILFYVTPVNFDSIKKVFW